MQKAIRWKLSLFGHVARMGDGRKHKIVMFGVIEEKNQRRRPHRDGRTTSIDDWGEDTLQKLYH